MAAAVLSAVLTATAASAELRAAAGTVAIMLAVLAAVWGLTLLLHWEEPAAAAISLGAVPLALRALPSTLVNLPEGYFIDYKHFIGNRWTVRGAIPESPGAIRVETVRAVVDGSSARLVAGAAVLSIVAAVFAPIALLRPWGSDPFVVTGGIVLMVCVEVSLLLTPRHTTGLLLRWMPRAAAAVVLVVAAQLALTTLEPARAQPHRGRALPRGRDRSGHRRARIARCVVAGVVAHRRRDRVDRRGLRPARRAALRRRAEPAPWDDGRMSDRGGFPGRAGVPALPPSGVPALPPGLLAPQPGLEGSSPDAAPRQAAGSPIEARPGVAAGIRHPQPLAGAPDVAPPAVPTPAGPRRIGGSLGTAFVGRPATVGRRIAAFSIDVVVVAAIAVVVWLLTGTLVLGAVVAIELAVGLWIVESRTGITPGNAALRLRTAREDGPFSPGVGRGFVRWFITGAGFLAAGIGRLGRRRIERVGRLGPRSQLGRPRSAHCRRRRPRAQSVPRAAPARAASCSRRPCS